MTILKLKKSIEIHEIVEKIEENYNPIFEQYESPEDFSSIFQRIPKNLFLRKKYLKSEISCRR